MRITISTKYLKTAAYFFNAVFFLMGLIMLGVGIWAELSVADMKELLSDNIITNAAILLMLSGGLTILLAGVGACAVRFEKRKILVYVCLSILLVFCLELAGGSYAFANRKDVRSNLRSGINDALTNTYGGVSPKQLSITAALDWIQSNVECCGAETPDDWMEGSTWFDNMGDMGHPSHPVVPASCCREVVDGCNVGRSAKVLVKQKSIFKQGCLEPADDYIKKHFKHVGRIGLAVGFIQLLGVLLVYGLSRKLKSRERNNKSRHGSQASSNTQQFTVFNTRNNNTDHVVDQSPLLQAPYDKQQQQQQQQQQQHQAPPVNPFYRPPPATAPPQQQQYQQQHHQQQHHQQQLPPYYPQAPATATATATSNVNVFYPQQQMQHLMQQHPPPQPSPYV